MFDIQNMYITLTQYQDNSDFFFILWLVIYLIVTNALHIFQKVKQIEIQILPKIFMTYLRGWLK